VVDGRAAQGVVGEGAQEQGQAQAQRHGHDQDRDDAGEASRLGSERGGQEARRPLGGWGIATGHSPTTLGAAPFRPRVSFGRGDPARLDAPRADMGGAGCTRPGDGKLIDVIREIP
jgi:hypothetical protein